MLRHYLCHLLLYGSDALYAAKAQEHRLSVDALKLKKETELNLSRRRGKTLNRNSASVMKTLAGLKVQNASLRWSLCILNDKDYGVEKGRMLGSYGGGSVGSPQRNAILGSGEARSFSVLKLIGGDGFLNRGASWELREDLSKSF